MQLREDSLGRAKRLLTERTVPHRDNRCAWAVGREVELSDCLSELVQYHEGFAEQHTTLTRLAFALLKRVEPLFSAHGPISAWAKHHLTAPYEALRDFLLPPEQGTQSN